MNDACPYRSHLCDKSNPCQSCEIKHLTGSLKRSRFWGKFHVGASVALGICLVYVRYLESAPGDMGLIVTNEDYCANLEPVDDSPGSSFIETGGASGGTDAVCEQVYPVTVVNTNESQGGAPNSYLDLTTRLTPDFRDTMVALDVMRNFEMRSGTFMWPSNCCNEPSPGLP